MRLARYGLLLCCILVAGCITGGPTGTGVSPTTTATPSQASPASTTAPTPYPEPTPVTELASTEVTCDESLSVSFWNGWTQNSVRVSYYLPANTSILLVTYIDGTVQSATIRKNTHDDGIHADGDKLLLQNALSGVHTVRTVVYQDSNGDGQFEKGVDSPCQVAGEVVQAGPTRMNFSNIG